MENFNLDEWYSFTLTVPPLKKVYYAGRKRTFSQMLPKQQYIFFEEIICRVIRPNKFRFIDYVYEFHDKNDWKHLHIHGLCKTNHINNVLEFVHDFYTYNSKIGIKHSQYVKLSNIQKTKLDISFWQTYISKAQDKIIYKSSYTTQLEETAKLDGKHAVFIETKDNYFDLSSLDSDDYNSFSKTYDFKGRNFIVEL